MCPVIISFEREKLDADKDCYACNTIQCEPAGSFCVTSVLRWINALAQGPGSEKAAKFVGCAG